MIKFIIIIIVLALLSGALYYFYLIKQEKFSLYEKPVLFKAYAHSIDGLIVVPLCDNPDKLTGEKEIASGGISEDFFQKSVADKEELYIIGSKDIMAMSGETYHFYLVRTERGKFGYIANYRLEEKNGKPFAPVPPKGPID